jgi:hypothetical protein
VFCVIACRGSSHQETMGGGEGRKEGKGQGRGGGGGRGGGRPGGRVFPRAAGQEVLESWKGPHVTQATHEAVPLTSLACGA